MVDAVSRLDTVPVRTPDGSTSGTANASSATVQVMDHGALRTYRALCEDARFGAAQSPIWVSAFADNPDSDMIVVIASRAGRPVLAMALEVVKSGMFRIARFPGGRHANGNFPVVMSGSIATFPKDFAAELLTAIAQARSDIDALALERQLRQIDGVANPLLGWSVGASPNIALACNLAGGFDAVLQRMNSKRKRKKHRAQMRKYEDAGGYAIVDAQTPQQVDTVLKEFFSLRAARFASQGIADSFADPSVRASLRKLFVDSLADPARPFRLAALEVGGVIRAVTGTSRRRGTVVCEFGAIRSDELAATSPGDFLFFEEISKACQEGYDVYDFSIGDEPYKRTWCDIETTQFDALVPLTTKGRVFVAGHRAATGVKRAIKRNAFLWLLAKKVRGLAGAKLAKSSPISE
ncbi:MAG: GNAT family N-acetyltransferase [Rhizobiaceae bacterium]|nr:GNAT family N-acetyltransferase [Rhizobiaceae bacterium]MCV0405277.1 GNAT family N-acetyltransferase [Rhizobiaceae bacterium]